MSKANLLLAGALVLGVFVVLPTACSSSDSSAGPSCTNGTQDGDEIGVDCGGTCSTKCTGAGCVANEECGSGKCENGTCAAPAGKPCGVGTAVATCNEGQPCELAADCASGSCENAKCVATKPGDVPPGPTDGKTNNGETDIDCGGPNAPKCVDGKTCAANADCATDYCPDATKKCITPTYTDGVMNGDETDVDCGGTATKPGYVKCAAGKTCLADGDCNGACNYKKLCIDEPSCKPHLGGDTCGAGEVGQPGAAHETCCKSLPVTGYTDLTQPGKAVYLDKYEITAGRVRAFVEAVTAAQGGIPDIKSWVVAHKPAIWGGAEWEQFLPGGAVTPEINVPHKPTNGTEAPPYARNMGLDYQFNQHLYVYVHGHNCGTAKGAFGLPTFFYPAAAQALSGSLPRANPSDLNGAIFPAQEALDVKSMNCITSAMLAAFCHWDGGQLATDEVLDYITKSPTTLGSNAGCGPAATGPTATCAPLAMINASSDSGASTPVNYYYPYYDNMTATSPEAHEGVSKIAAPGRGSQAAGGAAIDKVPYNAAGEGWMDVHGNLHEIALDMTGATFTGKFAVKYRGIGYSSARAGGNTPTGNLTYPEYRAGYSGGRCMRFK